MPIYEYRCKKCSHEFEELVRTSDQKIHCPKCQAVMTDRKLSTFSAVVSSASSCSARDECPTGSCCSGGSCPHSH